MTTSRTERVGQFSPLERDILTQVATYPQFRKK